MNPILLFDLDGTLCHSEPGIQASLRAALKALKYPNPTDADIRRIIGPPFTEGLPRLGIRSEDVALVIETYREHYRAEGAFLTQVFEGIPSMLKLLREREVTMAVATSKPEASAHPILDYLGLSDYFVVRAGATLDDSRSRKADVIAYALESLSARNPSSEHRNCLMIGDRNHDVLGAKVHGLPCVGVSYGYGDRDELLGAGAVDVVDSPAALSRWLENWLQA